LRKVDPDASLADATSSIPWMPLTQLFEAFADIRGIGFSKMTKALHRKRPALIPMLDSVVHAYLTCDDPERTDRGRSGHKRPRSCAATSKTWIVTARSPAPDPTRARQPQLPAHGGAHPRPSDLVPLDRDLNDGRTRARPLRRPLANHSPSDTASIVEAC
jgi:hypothetical protein